MATYGEGEPTDNAVTLVQNLRDEEFNYSNGEHTLNGLKYVVFGLGNRTYEHYNIISRQVDEALSKSGATRIGERGEGDDDKSMEEDYLAWKDGMWEEFSKALGVDEGAGADSADFAVTELNNVDQSKVYLGAFAHLNTPHYISDVFQSQANSLLALSTGQRASTTPRTPSLHLSRPSENSSTTRMTATVSTLNSISRDPVSLTNTVITLVSGHLIPTSKLTASYMLWVFTINATLLSASSLWIPLSPRFLSPYPQHTLPSSVII